LRFLHHTLHTLHANATSLVLSPVQVTCGVDGRVKLWMLTSASSVAGGSAGASVSSAPTLADAAGSKMDGMVSMNSNFTDSL